MIAEKWLRITFFVICSYLTPPLRHLSHQIITSVTPTILLTVSVCLLLSGRCRNSGRTAAYSGVRSQTRYISGGEQETEHDRHNPRFGCHYLAQTYIHISHILRSCMTILPSIYPFLTSNILLFQPYFIPQN